MSCKTFFKERTGETHECSLTGTRHTEHTCTCGFGWILSYTNATHESEAGYPPHKTFDSKSPVSFNEGDSLSTDDNMLVDAEIPTTVGPLPEKSTDMVNHPPHYSANPSGVECIDVTEHMNFNVGNAVKYLWRADVKGAPIEDLKKARWYVDREIARREKQ